MKTEAEIREQLRRYERELKIEKVTDFRVALAIQITTLEWVLGE